MVVDLVSKTAHFISTYTTVTIEGTARLFLYHIWKFYDLPNHIVLDQGLIFIVLFTRELYWLFGVKIALSIA